MARLTSDNEIELSTGRTIYANRGIVGIGPDLDLTQGYDGDIRIGLLTTAERLELVEFVIARWQRLRRGLKRNVADGTP